MTILSKSRSPRKPARETHGTCYLTHHGYPTLERALDSGNALLTIHAQRCTNYLVQRLSDPDGETVGYRLMKLTDYIVDRKIYDIDITLGYGWQCDCPDAVSQDRECKHVRSLRAALAANGIAIHAPKPEAKPVGCCFACDKPIPECRCTI